MLCTRWFLPLLILPVPSAQPYFLILFLLSLVLHARPCFYCISLLTALFMSSCYWQPVSIDSPLAAPWSENVTTFSDAWDVTLTNVSVPKPAVMHLTDRCWVDWSLGGIFNPFNVTEWERASIAKLKFDLMKEAKQKRDGESVSEPPDTSSDDSTEQGDSSADHFAATSSSDSRNQTVASAASLSRARLGAMLRDITALMWRRRGGEVAREPAETSSPAVDDSTPIARADSTSEPLTLATSQPNLPWLRREYSMRPYGFDIIFDLGWPQ
ncbi:hypothetical protein NEOLEDRAFT_1095451 [Neolentinus lepideus HHB14362 ss-1]|uniref:Uncharacterized protein n=1 Tax=Neolentinus lepideus HHB14362 ss-1 TaxID=1314782 RepID=A0A165RG38_9AGAM|nr:hypothetical protein NEOLEDRAFT_1095451 [Neolentinus lepideus HHB14362 ss-1]